MKGKLDGFSLRVPTPDGSLTDFVCVLEKEVTKEQINEAMKKASENEMKGILEYTIDPIVSMDSEGKAMLFGKTLGQIANINKVIKSIRKLTRQQRVWNYIVLHAHNKPGADIYINKMVSLTGKQPVSVVDISPVIGMNAGVGAIAVSLLLE